jgi:NADPH-dependent 2,4-dienoyl-CoA reductase/sulfur reductase-like enzyme
MSAASQARRLSPELEIIAFERGAFVSYSACGEPYYVGGIVENLDSLIARTPEEFAEREIEVHTHHEVVEVIPGQIGVGSQMGVGQIGVGQITVKDLSSGKSRVVEFDHLMISTGARPLRPTQIRGIDLPGVVGLRTLEDAEAIKAMLDDRVRKVLILGGGYIGIEMAEVLVDLGIEVTMVTSGQHVLEKTMDPEMGQLVNDAVRAYGVELRTGLRVECIEGTDRATGIAFGVECDQHEYSADLIVIGLGSGPEVDLAKAAGIPLGTSGAVAVDQYQRTRMAGIWSAGDCAEVIHRVTGQPFNVQLGTVANKTGRIAGTNIAAAINGTEMTPFPGAIGTAITKIGDTEIARTGLKVDQARAAGFEPVVGLASGTTTAGYWPTAQRIDLMIIADGPSGKVIGGQIVGGPGAGKKIDVIASAIWNGMTAGDLAWMDLAYAPPFSGVWDLIHIAARRASSTG